MCILTHLAPLHADNAWSACTTSVRWNGRGSEVRLNTTISRQRLQKRKKKSHSRHWGEYILDHSIGTFESIIKLALRCVYNIFLYVQIVQKCYYNIMNIACVYIVVSENIKVKWINSIFIWQGNKKHFIQFFEQRNDLLAQLSIAFARKQLYPLLFRTKLFSPANLHTNRIFLDSASSPFII